MKAALDVRYASDGSVAACVVFRDWSDSTAVEIVRATTSPPVPYHPGRFYERELPGLLTVLERADRELRTLIIDGYVHLRADVGKGLGAHLHDSIPYRAAIIGVAKTEAASPSTSPRSGTRWHGQHGRLPRCMDGIGSRPS